MSASAGRILLMDKGNYAAATQYTPLDLVNYQNNKWLCKKAALGVAPVEGEYWTLWVEGVAPMTGATDEDDGVGGLVPQPLAGDNTKALFGDGTFKEIPLPTDMLGASTFSDGAHGLVPAPLAGDENKFLKGDGTWGEAGSGNVNAITADVEVSPAEKFHAAGSYLTYNHNEYLVLKDIAIGTALDYESADPNIELADLPDGTYINTDDGDGEGGGGSSSADEVSYDNTTSELTATNVQDAIDEVQEEVTELNSNNIINDYASQFSPNTGYTVVSIILKKQGSLVVFDLEIKVDTAASSNVHNIGSLPATVKPTTRTVGTSVAINNDGSVVIPARFYIDNSSGVISVTGESTIPTGNYIDISVTFFI